MPNCWSVTSPTNMYAIGNEEEITMKKRYNVIGYHSGRADDWREYALCILEAETATEAMEKAIAHYGSERVTKCLEIGSDANRWWWESYGRRTLAGLA